MAKANQGPVIQTVRCNLPKLREPLPDIGLVQSESERALQDPNEWFAQRFPDEVKIFGAAFLVANVSDQFGRGKIVPIHLNTDFFAAILKGTRTGVHVVYYPPEKSFYHFDHALNAYCSVSDEKLKVLISNYLIRAAEDCGERVDIRSMVTEFRKDQQLDTVIDKARAILEADRAYFSGKAGHRRFIDGRYMEADEEPSYQVFVKKAIIAAPQGKVTVHDAFHRYYQFCKDNAMQPLTRQEFKSLVAEVIREEFALGLRHDIIGDNNKQGHGWCGIGYTPEFAGSFGRN